MKRLAIVLAALAVVIALFFLVPRTGTATIDITGPVGATFKGSSDVDGKTHELAGTVPFHDSMTGHELSISVELNEVGMTCALVVDSGNNGSVGPTADLHAHVRATVEYRPLQPSWWIRGE
jgi:hypothetical protein